MQSPFARAVFTRGVPSRGAKSRHGVASQPLRQRKQTDAMNAEDVEQDA